MTLENQLFCFYRHWIFEIALAFPNQFVRLQGKKEIVNIQKALSELVVKNRRKVPKKSKNPKRQKNARFR